MTALLCLHAVLGIGLLVGGRRLGRRCVAVGAVGPLAAAVWLAARAGEVVDGEALTEHADWVPSLGLAVDLRLDGFAALFTALVAGIGVLVFAYAGRYLPPAGRGVSRLAGFLTLFAGSMLGLVWADNLLVLYGFWELTSVTSYLLIGNDHDDARARAAGLQALLVTTLGGLAMLGGFVLLGQAAGTYELGELLADPPAGGVVPVALFLVLLGAWTKSAQYPFHSWLPGAMVASTPVSTYLHSATMVKAGVLLVARFGPAFAGTDLWRPAVISVGAVTMIAGALRALRQHDLKLLLAHGTVSQLGFMMVLFGAAVDDALVAGCVLVAAHGLFKAALFMVVGAVEHETGTRDLRALPELGAGWGWVKAATVVSCASMAGVPLLFGFVAKEGGFAALADATFAGAGVALAAIVVGSALTVAYSARFAWAVLSPGPAAVSPPPHAPPALLVVPAVVLATASVVLGVVPALADEPIAAAATALQAAVEPVHLALWHGPTVSVALSAVALTAGGLLVWAREPVARLLAAGAVVPAGGDVYLAILRGLNRLADRTTAVVQSGSLPLYTGVIITTAAALTGVALVDDGTWPGWPRWVVLPGQVPVAVAILTFALAAATSRRRFSAALFLGAVGYAMAGLFVVQGAPDLALTQVAIETLSTVLFVLVLRRLPARFEERAARGRQALRLGLSGLVGVVVFAMAVAASQSGASNAVSEELAERALPDGHGKNVVNVILVDFRGVDTLGEITVLATAAIGAVALARAGRVPAGHATTPVAGARPATATAGASVRERDAGGLP